MLSKGNLIQRISHAFTRPRRRSEFSSSEELSKYITCLFVDILRKITDKPTIYIFKFFFDEIRNVLAILLPTYRRSYKTNGSAKVVLLFDNYERIHHFLNPWLLNILSNYNLQSLAGKVKLVIVGRRKLSYHTAFPDPRARLTFQFVEPWTQVDAEYYLLNEGKIADPQHRALILELSGRLPRWLSVLASEYSSIAQNAIVSKTLIQRFLELYVEDPAQRRFILEVALARKFNFYVISELLGEEVAKDTFNLLTALPFIDQDLYGFYRFPDSIRELMLSLLRESPNSDVRRWNECHEKLARYYRLSLNFGFNYAQWSENQWISTWQRCVQFPVMEYYVLEAIYHDLCRSYPGNIQVMLNSLCAAAQVSGQLGVRLAHTIRQATRDCRYLDDMVENINLEALKLLKEFLVDYRLTPDQKKWLSKLCGIAYFNIADYNNALQYLNNVLKHLGNLSREDYEAYFYRAAIYLSKDDLKNARSDYDQAVQLAPDAPSRAAALVKRGEVLVRMGQYNNALADFNKAVELAPDAPSRAAALAGRGAVLYKMGRYNDALEDYNKAVELAPDAPSRAAALAGRGAVLYRMEQYDEALADFDKAIGLTEAIANEAPPLAARSAAPSAAVQLGFDRSRMYTWRGLTYMHKKQRIEALKDFNQAIKLDPDNAQAFYWRGLAHLEMRSYAQAENDFNVASRLEPRYAAPLAALAQLHLRIARETLIQADYLCKVNPEIHPQPLTNEIGRRIADLQRLLGGSTGTA